ncbi:hypothetical protein L210DRAFT_2376708 [Boletus edulis BED1]|uniref:Uncharacterized protein n=1 Tax=Boletus edulis BED1 TaxID=1328754 RepID=A0AAD4GKT9_BOLED|nr:hypothetical protein L210DRAFT_2376708 [Boletus edulis BED1]
MVALPRAIPLVALRVPQYVLSKEMPPGKEANDKRFCSANEFLGHTGSSFPSPFFFVQHDLPRIEATEDVPIIAVVGDLIMSGRHVLVIERHQLYIRTCSNGRSRARMYVKRGSSCTCFRRGTGHTSMPDHRRSGTRVYHLAEMELP